MQALHEVECAFLAFTKFAAQIGHEAEAAVAETLNDFRMPRGHGIDKGRHADGIYA